MKNIILVVLFIVLTIAVSYFLIRAMDYGLTKTEVNECIKWNKEAKIYEGYYYAEWQLEQCKAVGYPLDPIKTYTAD